MRALYTMGPSPSSPWPAALRASLDALPAAWGLPHEAALLALYRGTCDEPGAPVRALRDDAALWEAWWRDELRLTDGVRVGGRAATVGRHLAASLLPRPVGEEARALPWTRARLEGWLRAVAGGSHVEVAARCSVALGRLGDAWSARLGGSWCVDDLRAPPTKAAVIDAARAAVARVEADYQEGVITDGERYNKAIDRMSAAFDRIVGDAQGALVGTALEACVRASSAPSRWREVSVAVGLVAKADGSVLERPILPSFAQGLDAHDFMSLATARRAGELGARQKLAEVAAMFGDLRAALGALRVVARDCGAVEGTVVKDASDDLGPLFERVRGRTLAADVVTLTGVVVARAGETVGDAHRAAWGRVERVTIRSPGTCRARDGVCAKCYGRDPDDGTEVPVGEPVGLRAAWAIAALVARLPGEWRSYGMAGSLPRVPTSRDATLAGVVLVEPELFVNGTVVRPGRIEVVADDGTCETLFVCEGDRLQVAHGARVEARTAVAAFDPNVGRVYTAPLAAGRCARVSFEAPPGAIQLEGARPWSAAPEAPRWLVTTAVGGDYLALHLRVEGAVVRTVFVAVGSTLRVRDGDVVEGGAVLATAPLPEAIWTRFEDGLDGLRRTLDLVQPHPWRREPHAVFAPFDGVVVDGAGRERDTGRITLEGFRGERFTRRVGRHHRAYYAGEVVLRGDALTYGHQSLPRLLRYRGERHVFDALVWRFEYVAAAYGQGFAAVHAELLARAMLDWRRVRRAGDSGLKRDAVVPRAVFERACEEAAARGGAAPEGVTVIRGLGALAGRRWKVSHRGRMEARAAEREEAEEAEREDG